MPQSNSSALLKTLPQNTAYNYYLPQQWCETKWLDKQNKKRIVYVQVLRPVGVMWACLWLPRDDISRDQKHYMNLNDYESASQSCFVAHTSGCPLLGRNITRTREISKIKPTILISPVAPWFLTHHRTANDSLSLVNQNWPINNNLQPWHVNVHTWACDLMS